MKKTVIAAALLVGLTAGQSYALTIDFGYQTPTDGSGKTSTFVNANNTATGGYFIETFDKPGSSIDTINISGGTVQIAAGGGFNSLNPDTDLQITAGTSIGIQKGSNSSGAAPAGDTTFYAYGPGSNSGSTVSLRVNYDDFLADIPGYYLSYLGMYYGSIDTYNNIAFYNGNQLFQGTGLLADGVLSGQEILTAMNGTSGNQFQSGSNVYVNLSFDPSESFTAFEFRTTGIAFEVDNIVSGFAPVPEPSTMMLLGLGLFGMAVYGKRRMDSKKA